VNPIRKLMNVMNDDEDLYSESQATVAMLFLVFGLVTAICLLVVLLIVFPWVSVPVALGGVFWLYRFATRVP
jgi:Flp pilus assembly protein TadB